MVTIDTPVTKWLESVLEDPQEKCEILSDLLGDNLAMVEFAPARMDDDMLGTRRHSLYHIAFARFSALTQLCWSNVCILLAEVVEQLELEDEQAFLDQLTALRPQLQQELDLAEAAAQAAEAEAAKVEAEVKDGGADPERTGSDSCTPLMAAAVQGQLEVLRLLLARGAAVDVEYIIGY